MMLEEKLIEKIRSLPPEPFMEATPFEAHVSSPQYSFDGKSMPMVDLSAARSKDGKIWLALVNSDPHRTAHLATNLPGTAKGTILTGPAMDSHNTFDAPNAVHPVAYSGSSENGKAGQGSQEPASDTAATRSEMTRHDQQW